MLVRRQADHAWLDLPSGKKPPARPGGFVPSVLKPHHRVGPFVRNPVFDRGRDRLDELLRSRPAAVPVPIELRPDREGPRPRHMPPRDEVAARDERPWIALFGWYSR